MEMRLLRPRTMKSTAKHASARASALRVENPSAIDAECLSFLLSGRPLVRTVDVRAQDPRTGAGRT